MSFGVVINVAIGLIFVYLLLGLIGSALQEAIAGWLNWRGQQLRRAIATLLEHPLPASGPTVVLFDKVFGHGLIAPDPKARWPSYVPSQNFRRALFAAFLDGSAAPVFSQVEAGVASLPACGLRDSLVALLVEAGGDLDKLSSSIERWFDDSMDRVSGIYKRLANNFMLIFGLAIAAGANIDTIVVANYLWTHPLISAQVAQQAQDYVQAHPQAVSAPASDAASAAASSASAVADAVAAHDVLASLPIPMGYPLATPLAGAGFLFKLLGWLMTALAVSLGAPFWFDTLQRFINIRNAGPAPAKSADSAN